ncbi:MAG: xanthine dehydrogenase family protein subunit M [Acidobacteria bacterium]|nr:xanthine dehydrogenase family protein subunit M [Acidobacteriota bacterium]
MIPARFEYSAPETLSEALRLLGSDGEAKVLAGGQSLVPMMKFRLAQPGHLIDLARIPDLNFVAEENGAIRIGAMTTHNQVETSALIREKCPLLAKTAAHIGDVQVRNRGTIGGSVVHADPAADYPAALLAMEAKVKLVSASGERMAGLDEFLVDALTTLLEEGEILTEVHVPLERAGVLTAYRTLVQPASGFAMAGVGVRLGVENGTITFARVALTGVGSKPYRATAVEQALVGQGAGAETFAAAAAHATDGVDALSDMHASAEYRVNLAAVQVRRALEDAAGSA